MTAYTQSLFEPKARYVYRYMYYIKKKYIYILYIRVIHFKLLFFISFWHLKIVCEIKKKKSSLNLHDVKKHLEVATEDSNDFTSTVIFFLVMMILRYF